jgi:hypothetical protein
MICTPLAEERYLYTDCTMYLHLVTRGYLIVINHQSFQYSQSQANLQQSQPSSFPKQKASSAGFEPSSGGSYPLAIFMAVRLETSPSGTRLLLARILSATVILQQSSTSWTAELKIAVTPAPGIQKPRSFIARTGQRIFEDSPQSLWRRSEEHCKACPTFEVFEASKL